jgi:hypothetical protein
MPSGIVIVKPGATPQYRNEDEWDSELVRAYASGQWAVPGSVVEAAMERMRAASRAPTIKERPGYTGAGPTATRRGPC